MITAPTTTGVPVTVGRGPVQSLDAPVRAGSDMPAILSAMSRTRRSGVTAVGSPWTGGAVRRWAKGPGRNWSNFRSCAAAFCAISPHSPWEEPP